MARYVLNMKLAVKLTVWHAEWLLNVDLFPTGASLCTVVMVILLCLSVFGIPLVIAIAIVYNKNKKAKKRKKHVTCSGTIVIDLRTCLSAC